ncbi:AMP-binding protein [Aromatoleum toluvorans]|uniref:AMP-binding protein n=1 Tax=Aromatoleum toluvorans TaxID=92002 RepID=A0ABX1PWH0_9RHOO|nr:AMP-binding protein [Aromatoleum toluvorans]NMG43784.1 AMP-binding protein [Aromatoleum toluvorans]
MTATVFDAFTAAAGQWGERPFLCILPDTAAAYGIAPSELAYRDAAQRIEALRQAYAAAGYGPGHRVGLLLENRPAFFLHWFALNALGVSVVPINADLRAAELEYLIGHSEIALAVALPQRHADLAAAAERAGRPLHIISDGDTPPAAAFPAPLAGTVPGELTECALLYTSGTTGRPKGCMLPNRYFLHAGRWYANIGGLARLMPGEERMITPLPLVHMNAMAYSTMAMLMTGGCLVPLDRFHPKRWWANVREARATVVHYLGVMPAMLMKAEASPEDRAHSVRFGFGAGVDRTLHAAFETRFGFPLLEAWAMTETGAGAVVIANHEPRKVGTSCFGKEASDIEVRIATEDGRDAATDEPGELLVRHAGDDPRYGFLAGYLKDEAATAEAWAGGWFHTGDVVRRDVDGHLHFVDRKKNVIRRSGENIAAVEVESVLQQHPLVKAVAVAAVPDPVRGDEVMACIVPQQPLADRRAMEAAAEELVRWTLGELAYYKAPGHIAFVDGLPLTVTNKIQRGELKALAPTLVGAPECVDTCALKKRQETAT